MANWIYLATLFYVGAVFSCRDGERRKVRNSDSGSSLMCTGGKWYRDERSAAIRTDTENTVHTNIRCQDVEPYRDIHEKDIYYQCDYGKLVSKRCAPGKEFDTVEKICLTPPVTVPAPDQDPNPDSRSEHSGSELEADPSDLDTNVASMCEEDILYADISDSTTYYKCMKGKLVSQLCSSDTLFDSGKQRCVSPQADLSVGSSIIEKKGHCIHGGTRKKEGYCKQYYECIHGKEIIQRCMDCQNYDENEKRCRYVFDFPCHSQFPEPPTTSAPERFTTPAPEAWRSHQPSSEATTSVTQITDMTTSITKDGGSSTSTTEAYNEVSTRATVTTATAPVTKPSNSSEPGSTALPFEDCKHRRALPDCKYYLECHEGELVTRRCGWLQYFDSLTNTCSFMGYTCFGTV